MSEEILSEEKISELKTEFAAFDKEGNGVISADDLIALLRCIGLNPTKSQCEEYKQKCANENNLVDFSMILNLVQSIGWDREEEENRLNEAFGEFDQDKSGFIDEETLRKKLSSLGDDQLSKEDIDELLSLQQTIDGKVDYKELARVICDRM